MSDRQEIFELLSAYVDGELSADEARRVEAAAASDAALAAELRRQRAVRGLVRQLGRQKAPPDFVARVVARAERKRLVDAGVARAEGPALPWLRFAATAATVLIAVGIGGVVALTVWNTPHVIPTAAPAENATHLAKDLSSPAPDGDAAYKMKARGGEGGGTSAGAGRGLAKGIAVGLADERLAASVRNVEIYTDDLSATRKDVETVLRMNSIAPARETLDDQSLRKEQQDALQAANTYYAKEVPRRQVQILAYVPAEQMAPLEQELKSIRSQQRVSQKEIPQDKKAEERGVAAPTAGVRTLAPSGDAEAQPRPGEPEAFAGKHGDQPAGQVGSRGPSAQTAGPGLVRPSFVPPAPAPSVAPAATALPPAAPASVPATAPAGPSGRETGEGIAAQTQGAVARSEAEKTTANEAKQAASRLAEVILDQPPSGIQTGGAATAPATQAGETLRRDQGVFQGRAGLKALVITLNYRNVEAALEARSMPADAAAEREPTTQSK